MRPRQRPGMHKVVGLAGWQTGLLLPPRLLCLTCILSPPCSLNNIILGVCAGTLFLNEPKGLQGGNLQGVVQSISAIVGVCFFSLTNRCGRGRATCTYWLRQGKGCGPQWTVSCRASSHLNPSVPSTLQHPDLLR